MNGWVVYFAFRGIPKGRRKAGETAVPLLFSSGGEGGEGGGVVVSEDALARCCRNDPHLCQPAAGGAVSPVSPSC